MAEPRYQRGLGPRTYQAFNACCKSPATL